MPLNDFDFETIFREGHPLDSGDLETGFQTPIRNPGVSSPLGQTLRRALQSDPELASDLDLDAPRARNSFHSALLRQGLF